MIIPQSTGLAYPRGVNVEFIGSASLSSFFGSGWNTSNRLDVLSVASEGDLVVVAFSFDRNGNSSWSWGGMTFTPIVDRTSYDRPGYYSGYRVVQSGDTNPFITGIVDPDWIYVSAAAAVFSPCSHVASVTTATEALTGSPNPPSLTAAGDLWIATAHVDDEIATFTAPTDYTMAVNSQYGGSAGSTSTTGIAYRIASLSSDNPGAFGGVSTSNPWGATISAYAGA